MQMVLVAAVESTSNNPLDVRTSPQVSGQSGGRDLVSQGAQRLQVGDVERE